LTQVKKISAHSARTSPSPQKKTYLISPFLSSLFVHLPLLYYSPRAMPAVFSKMVSPAHMSSEGDMPFSRLGSHVAWSPPPAFGNHSDLAGRDTDDHIFPGSSSGHYTSHHRGPSRPAALHYRSHHATVSEDRRPRSYISISSDDPGPAEPELTRLREEVVQLKTERKQLRRLTEIAYESYLFHYAI